MIGDPARGAQLAGDLEAVDARAASGRRRPGSDARPARRRARRRRARPPRRESPRPPGTCRANEAMFSSSSMMRMWSASRGGVRHMCSWGPDRSASGTTVNHATVAACASVRGWTVRFSARAVGWRSVSGSLGPGARHGRIPERVGPAAGEHDGAGARRSSRRCRRPWTMTRIAPLLAVTPKKCRRERTDDRRHDRPGSGAVRRSTPSDGAPSAA